MIEYRLQRAAAWMIAAPIISLGVLSIVWLFAGPALTAENVWTHYLLLLISGLTFVGILWLAVGLPLGLLLSAVTQEQTHDERILSLIWSIYGVVVIIPPVVLYAIPMLIDPFAPETAVRASALLGDADIAKTFMTVSLIATAVLVAVTLAFIPRLRRSYRGHHIGKTLHA